tara:strand:+ start:1528 stop:2475 length:948 start_codon:yes stop_codon:yes gene_type:complete
MNTKNQYNDKDIKAGLDADGLLDISNNTVTVTWAGGKPSGLSTTLKGKTKELVRDTKAKKGRVRSTATVIESRANSIGKLSSLIQQTIMDYKIGTHPSDVRGVRLVPTNKVADIQQMIDEKSRELGVLRRKALAEWPTIYADSVEGLGDNISEVTVPANGEEFLSEFKIAVDWSAAPMAIKKGTIFEGMTEEITNKVIAKSERVRIDNMARNHAKTLEPLMKKLKDAIAKVSKGQRLHQKTFDELTEAASEVKELNWFQFDVIDDVIRATQEVGKIQRDHLGKEGSIERKLAKEAIEDVYEQTERTARRLAVCGL